MAKENSMDMAHCRARMDRVFARFLRAASGRSQTDVLVCHGNVIRNG